MIQLPRVGWRLLACQNGTSPDFVVVLLDTVNGDSMCPSTPRYELIGTTESNDRRTDTWVPSHPGVELQASAPTPKPSSTHSSARPRGRSAKNGVKAKKSLLRRTLWHLPEPAGTFRRVKTATFMTRNCGISTVYHTAGPSSCTVSL